MPYWLACVLMLLIYHTPATTLPCFVLCSRALATQAPGNDCLVVVVVLPSLALRPQ